MVNNARFKDFIRSCKIDLENSQKEVGPLKEGVEWSGCFGSDGKWADTTADDIAAFDAEIAMLTAIIAEHSPANQLG
jgi:hypothetical protein